jgi:putative membrane protein
MRQLAIAVMLEVFLLSGGPVSAAQTPEPSKIAKGTLSPQDRDFIDKAGRAGLAEVQLSLAAEQRLANPELKGFAVRMQTDHGKANAELVNIAKAKGVLPPSEPDDAHRELRTKLGQLTGNELERRYVECMLKDHEEAVALFENQVARGQDPDLKKFAQDTLPTVRHHLEMVRNFDPKQKKAPPAHRP